MNRWRELPVMDWCRGALYGICFLCATGALAAGQPESNNRGQTYDTPWTIVSALTPITEESPDRCVEYALGLLKRFCHDVAALSVKRGKSLQGASGLPVLVGPEAVRRHAPGLAEEICWRTLGEEGFVLRLARANGMKVLVAAGATERGTRHAVYALLRMLDVSRLPPVLPSDLSIQETPSFALRGMYAHQHWAYNHPYALRSWTVDDWKRYVDLLAILRVNLLQIWSMAGILPVPLSAEDEAFLRRYPPVIDHARRNHGMEVWIGECANNVCEGNGLPPAAERHYFDVESLKDPGDPEQMGELEVARQAFYSICDGADGYWVIDSDPGKWPGSPAGEFVDILEMNRRLIDSTTRLGKKAKLIYWMWLGWGTGTREENWRETLEQLIRRSPEPWWMTVAGGGQWEVVDNFGVEDRVVYYPYGAVEPEPSLPFTTVVPEVIPQALDIPERVGRIRGVLGNAQTPVCQLPNIHYFTSAIWDLDLQGVPVESSVRILARLVYAEQADLLARAWLSLGSPEAPRAEELADRLQALEEDGRLGRPGPIGWLLVPDPGQIARDLAAQLRIHAVARRFCRLAPDEGVSKDKLLSLLKRYCVLSLDWRRRTGFRNYGTNGYDWFPLHEAIHARWWGKGGLDPEVYSAIRTELQDRFDDWEAELVLLPLRQ